MKKATIIGLIVLVIGVVMAGVGFAYGGMYPYGPHFGDGANGVRPGSAAVRSNDKMEIVDKTWENTNEIKSLRVDLRLMIRAEIRAEGDSFSVKGQNLLSVGGLKAEVVGGTLMVEPSQDSTTWWNSFWDFVNFRIPLRSDDCYVVVTVPENLKLDRMDADISVGSLSITGIDAKELSANADTGSSTLRNIRADRFTLRSSTGDCKLTDIHVSEADIQIDTGSTTMQNLQADRFTLRSSIGSCKLTDVRVSEADIQTDTGEFMANGFASSKALTFKKSLGSATFTDAVLEGTSRFDTDTGSLTLSLNMPRETVGYEISSNAGSVRIDGADVRGDVTNIPPGATSRLTVNSSVGSVRIDFAE